MFKAIKQRSELTLSRNQAEFLKSNQILKIIKSETRQSSLQKKYNQVHFIEKKTKNTDWEQDRVVA